MDLVAILPFYLSTGIDLVSIPGLRRLRAKPDFVAAACTPISVRKFGPGLVDSCSRRIHERPLARLPIERRALTQNVVRSLMRGVVVSSCWQSNVNGFSTQQTPTTFVRPP